MKDTDLYRDVSVWQPSGAVDSLDAKIERLLQDWNHGSDMLFSIHPSDGSLLIWFVGSCWLSIESFPLC